MKFKLPIVKSYETLKAKNPSVLLLIKVGDFYNAFHEDAKTLAKEMDITLIKYRSAPMSGVPYHSLEPCLTKLKAAGHRIGIVEGLSPLSIRIEG